ncbi:respiratory nitrate reductase subunit gamma [Thioalkalivibrio sp. HK1]|uniref:respiratory nitrate reductase subunit gamma n=1 Tax=Thioalkalivibrio sp. HK1 TaxID=1469245 RepID=UPI000470138F|nr:respiratory nitrate reductase subunit gamma [Thioalkalivibrio sp. HK1]
MLVLPSIIAIAFYLAALILVVGVAGKILQYARTPAPLKIPTTPAPTTRSGTILRLAREVVYFESLFKASKWTWLFGWIFHAALVVALIGHLRYFTEPAWWPAALVQGIALWVGLAMLVGLGGLWARRIFVDRVRYISAPSDHLMLALLVIIAGSGVFMRLFLPTDIVELKIFTLGLVRFDWQTIPVDAILLLHIVSALALMAIFPFSKLLHVPGLFFSPTRNQADDPRERRHLPRWTPIEDRSASASMPDVPAEPSKDSR